MPTKETVRKSGGLVTSTARSARSRRQQCRWHASNRNVGQRPFVLLRGTSSFNRGWRPRGGSRRFVARGFWPCACTVGRSSEEPTFLRVVLTIVSLWQKSDERRHRRGSAQNPGDRAASRSETQSRATSAARSSPGRWKALWIIRRVGPFTGRAREGGLGRSLAGSSSSKERGTSSRESAEGRRCAVTGASEGESSVDATGRKRPRRTTNRNTRSVWGVVKTRHASEAARKGNSTGSPNETWVPVVVVSLAEAGRTHLWSMTCCVRREAWPQAARERRSRLDLATEQFAHPSMGGRTRTR